MSGVFSCITSRFISCIEPTLSIANDFQVSPPIAEGVVSPRDVPMVLGKITFLALIVLAALYCPVLLWGLVPLFILHLYATNYVSRFGELATMATQLTDMRQNNTALAGIRDDLARENTRLTSLIDNVDTRLGERCNQLQLVERQFQATSLQLQDRMRLLEQVDAQYRSTNQEYNRTLGEHRNILDQQRAAQANLENLHQRYQSTERALAGNVDRMTQILSNPPSRRAGS